MLAFFRNDMGFGGNNGFTDFKRILGFPITAPETRTALYVLSGLTLLGALLLARWIVTSKLGRVLTAIRDQESRLMFLGYRTLYFKLFIWTLAAMMSGIAGALVRAAGRHHQSERNESGQLDRDRDLGRGRRTWNAVRSDPRRIRGQRREDLVHGRVPGAVALLPRPALRARDAAAAARPDGLFDDCARCDHVAVPRTPVAEQDR